MNLVSRCNPPDNAKGVHETTRKSRTFPGFRVFRGFRGHTARKKGQSREEVLLGLRGRPPTKRRRRNGCDWFDTSTGLAAGLGTGQFGRAVAAGVGRVALGGGGPEGGGSRCRGHQPRGGSRARTMMFGPPGPPPRSGPAPAQAGLARNARPDHGPDDARQTTVPRRARGPMARVAQACGPVRHAAMTTVHRVGPASRPTMPVISVSRARPPGVR